MIDTHAHIYRYVTGRFGLDADMVGVESGVTTLIDQGGASCMTFPGFRHFVAEKAASRCYAFISAYLVGGLEGHYYPALYSPAGIDVKATVAAAKANRDLVKGIKAHAEIGGFARWGTTVMEMASEIGRDADLPVYVHFGQLWALPPEGANGVDADTIVERTVAPAAARRHSRPSVHAASRRLRRQGRQGAPDHQGRASTMGLKIDVGHGSHFSYRLARKAIDAGIVPHTLGADMHGYNTFVPPPPGTPGEHPDDENHPFAGQARFSLTQAMSSMLALGLTLAAGGADGDEQRRRDGRRPRRDRRVEARHGGRRLRAQRRARPLQAAGQRADRDHRRTPAGAGVLPARRPPLRGDGADPAARDRGVAAMLAGWATLEPGGARRRLQQQCGRRQQRRADRAAQRGLGRVSHRPSRRARRALRPGAAAALRSLSREARPRRRASSSSTAATGSATRARISPAIAEGVLAHGWSTALPGYTLAPDATLDARSSARSARARLARRQRREAWRSARGRSSCPAGRRAATSPRWRSTIPASPPASRSPACSSSRRSATPISTRSCA